MKSLSSSVTQATMASKDALGNVDATEFFSQRHDTELERNPETDALTQTLVRTLAIIVAALLQPDDL